MTAPHKENAKRILENIAVLLGQGQFPGAYAASLQEAQQFIVTMIKDIEADLEQNREKEQAEQGVRNQEDPSGVAGS